MIRSLFVYPLLLLILSCYGQVNKNTKDIEVGGPCENCYELADFSAKELNWFDTLPDFSAAKNPLKIDGIIYQADGKTPASDVILFVYQTDETGNYQLISQQPKKHKHRGWIKTDETGQYTFYTFLPGAYPNGREVIHIHPVIKEPGKTAYYIDDFVFDHDPLLNASKRNQFSGRGGSGIVKLEKQNGILIGQRDIILGKNVPNY